MTLDEMEELADLFANHYDSAAVHASDAAVDLARAVLALLPVVRAAIAWKDVADDPGAAVWPYTEKLDNAIDTMRAALGGGE